MKKTVYKCNVCKRDADIGFKYEVDHKDSGTYTERDLPKTNFHLCNYCISQIADYFHHANKNNRAK